MYVLREIDVVRQTDQHILRGKPDISDWDFSEGSGGLRPSKRVDWLAASDLTPRPRGWAFRDPKFEFEFRGICADTAADIAACC